VPRKQKREFRLMLYELIVSDDQLDSSYFQSHRSHQVSSLMESTFNQIRVTLAAKF
jgi:hypothetical protein